jgi:hypothetical protein
MLLRTTELLPGDILDADTDCVDTLDRCPTLIGGVVYALDVTRNVHGKTVQTVRYAGGEAIHQVVRPCSQTEHPSHWMCQPGTPCRVTWPVVR